MAQPNRWAHIARMQILRSYDPKLSDVLARTTASIRMSEDLVRRTKELLEQSRMLQETSAEIAMETGLWRDLATELARVKLRPVSSR
jgi:hypothetical protein